MAKQRVKELWGTKVTQAADGSWEWELSGVRWRWGHQVGINLEATIGTAVQGVAHFPKLHDAMFYTFGFEAGVAHMAKTQQPADGERKA